MTDLSKRVTEAADSLRANRLPRLDNWCTSCAGCDFAGIWPQPRRLTDAPILSGPWKGMGQKESDVGGT
ncbi:hypothetical protein [Streptomyces sp. NPDC058632]|uniref:hypothetical protein n=1 Tax=unclassified Streptomyces TaxID=2593676 RepID=UPI003669086C